MCYFLLVRFGDKCRVKCGEKTNLRKEYKECDLNHAIDEYSTNILLMRKKGESGENDCSRMSNLLSLGV